MQPKYVTQYSGVWSMRLAELQAAAAYAREASIEDLLRDEPPDDSLGVFDAEEIAGNVAHLSMVGEITKYPSCMFEGTSTELFRRKFRLAAEKADTVVISFDSPGGSSRGVDLLAAEIREAREGGKRIVGVVEDECYSGAYWLASQVTELYAHRGARIGSIGAYYVLMDTSAAAARAGVTVHVISAGQYKGLAEDGVPIGEDEIAMMQREVDDVAALFRSAIEQGRGNKIADVEKLQTGEVWTADQAAGLGLIDGVLTGRAAFAQLIENGPPGPNVKGVQTMAEQPTGAKPADAAAAGPEEKEPATQMPEEEHDENSPATIGELEEAVEGATDEELMSFLRQGYSVQQAVDEMEQKRSAAAAAGNEQNTKVMNDLMVELGRATEQLEEVKAELAQAKEINASAGPGVSEKTLEEKPDTSAPGDGFLAEVRAYAAEQKIPYRKALSTMAKKYPDRWNAAKRGEPTQARPSVFKNP